MQTILHELKNKNELLNNLEILAGKSYLSSFPSHLEIEFTNACNLRCFMCYQSSLKVDYTQIEINTLNNVVSILPYVKTILIAGLGEQLVYRRIVEFLEIATGYSCDVSMFTNGLLAHTCLDIFRHISHLTVSFDGATRDVFETQRHGANFERIVRNIRLIRATYPNLKLKLNCVVSKLNVTQIEQIVKLGYDMGVNIVSFPYVEHAPIIELTKSDYLTIKTQLDNAGKFAGENNMIIEYNDIEYIKNVDNKNEIEDENLLKHVKRESEYRETQTPKDLNGLRKIMSSQNNIREIEYVTLEKLEEANNFLDVEIKKVRESIKNKPINVIEKPHCLSVWNYAFIKMNGNFRLCPYFNFEAGNIDIGGPLKGLNDSRLAEIRRSIRKREDLLPVCESCPDRFHREFNYEIFRQVCDTCGVVIVEK